MHESEDKPEKTADTSQPVSPLDVAKKVAGTFLGNTQGPPASGMDVHELFNAMTLEQQEKANAGAHAWYKAVLNQKPEEMALSGFLHHFFIKAERDIEDAMGAGEAPLRREDAMAVIHAELGRWPKQIMPEIKKWLTFNKVDFPADDLALGAAVQAHIDQVINRIDARLSDIQVEGAPLTSSNPFIDHAITDVVETALGDSPDRLASVVNAWLQANEKTGISSKDLGV